MYILITPEELEKEFIEPWKLNLIKSVHIDYATNAIHGWFGDNEVIIFKFNNYGFVNDNRYNSYRLSSGQAGITIQISLS
jgi:hypothetical protein